MLMEVIADEGDKWKLLNHTTNETVKLDKAFLEKSIRLGNVEEVLDDNDL
jgi:hypothetical protein